MFFRVKDKSFFVGHGLIGGALLHNRLFDESKSRSSGGGDCGSPNPTVVSTPIRLPTSKMEELEIDFLHMAWLRRNRFTPRQGRGTPVCEASKYPAETDAVIHATSVLSFPLEMNEPLFLWR